MFGRKKKEAKTEDKPITPQPVMAGSDEGSNILVGNQNNPRRMVVVKQTYNGTPDKDFRFAVDESMISRVYIEDVGYLDETVIGSVKPSKYWEKKTFGMKAKNVSVLSFSDKPFTIATGCTVRVPGGDINCTVRVSFKFKDEDPRAIAALLLSSFVKDTDRLDVHYKYITAEDFEKELRTELQDIIRGPMFTETVYANLEEIQPAILQRIKDTAFFVERSLDASEVYIRADKTGKEEIQVDKEKHENDMARMEMEKEARDKAVELAKSDSQTFEEL